MRAQLTTENNVYVLRLNGRRNFYVISKQLVTFYLENKLRIQFMFVRFVGSCAKID